MVKAFIDSDVILDFLTEREPFVHEASQIFSLSELKKIELCTSPVVISNCYYILRKFSPHNFVIKQLVKLTKLVDILDMNKQVVLSALTSNFKDFEDALQNYTASHGKVGIIITRNLKDYSSSNEVILSPTEFLHLSEITQ